jgi:hypothetical protein
MLGVRELKSGWDCSPSQGEETENESKPEIHDDRDEEVKSSKLTGMR